MFDTIVFVTQDGKTWAEGQLRNQEKVHIICGARNHLANIAETDDITGLYVRCNVLPNQKGSQPWFTKDIHKEGLATGEDFTASTPPSIADVKNTNGSNGNGDHDEIVDLDELDDVVENLATAIEPLIPCTEPKELRKQISNQLIDEGVDPATTNFTRMVATKIKQVKDEHHDRAREVLAQILSKGAIPGFIHQQCKRLIELSPEYYWHNGFHPKTIMTDIKECEPVSEPESAAAEPEAAVA